MAFVLGGQLDKVTDVFMWSRFGLMLGHLPGIGNCHSQKCLLDQSTGGVHEEGIGSKSNGPDSTPQGHNPP